MPILNSIGALSLEEGGDNAGAPVITGYIKKVVPNYDGTVVLILRERTAEVYERDSVGSYNLALTVANPIAVDAFTADGDISSDGKRIVVGFKGNGVTSLISRVVAYTKTTSWTLNNTITDNGLSNNSNAGLGDSISVSWADNGCIITEANSAVTSTGWYDGYVYYYGNIWSSINGTVRTLIPRASAYTSGIKTWPRAALLSNNGSYVRVASGQSSFVNTDDISVTTKTAVTIPSTVKFHEMSSSLNVLNREYKPQIYSGDKNVRLDIYRANNSTVVPALGTTATIDKVIINYGILSTTPPVITIITVPTYAFSWTTGVAVDITPATSTGTGTPVYSISPTLPAGLSFNTATSRITGIPTATQLATNYTITVNYSGVTDSGGISIAIEVPRVVTATNLSYSFTVNKAVASTNTVTVSGFQGITTYSISPALPTGLTFNTSTGAISGTPTAVSAGATYTVSVDDSSVSKSADFILEITVLPLVVSQLVTSLYKIVKSPITTTSIVSVSGGIAPYSYSISPALPTGLTFNTSTGAISGTPTVFGPATTYTITIIDSSNQTSTVNLSVEIYYPSITTTQLVTSISGIIGTAITTTNIVSATGGIAPYSYSITPALPAGITFNTSTGAISGTPTTYSASTSYTIQISDSVVSTKKTVGTINVFVDYTPVIISSGITALNAEINMAVSITIASASGGLAPYSYSITPALPAGLTFNSSSSTITGTPAIYTASKNYTVTVNDSSNKNASTSFSLIVDYPNIYIDSYGDGTYSGMDGILYVINQYKSLTPVIRGGTAPFTYSIIKSKTTDPDLPSGLSFNTSTGVISGTATTELKPWYTWYFSVKDSRGKSASYKFLLGSVKKLELSQPYWGQSPTGKISIPVDNSITEMKISNLTGGYGTYSYTVSPGLPTDLKIKGSTDVLIYGTPNSLSNYNDYTITVTDSRNQTYSVTTTIGIYTPPKLTINVSTQIIYSIGKYIDININSLTGGTLPYSYSITPSLPSGFNLNDSTGNISGTTNDIIDSKLYSFTASDQNFKNPTGIYLVESKNVLGKVFPDDSKTADQQFGISTSINSDGTYCAIGTNKGLVYIFYRDGPYWSQQAKLSVDSGLTPGSFGSSLSINSTGEYLVVNSDGNSGSYIFTRNGTTWSKQQRISYASRDVSINSTGEYVVLSNPGNSQYYPLSNIVSSASKGELSIFKRNGTTWSKQATLTSNSSNISEMGNKVVINADGSIVAAASKWGSSSIPESVFIFTRNGTTWTEQNRIQNPMSTVWQGNGFGSSIDISQTGDYIIIGSPYDGITGGVSGAPTTIGSGAVYVYYGTNNIWTQQNKLTPSDSKVNYFGTTISINSDANVIAIGSPQTSKNFGDGGQYIFSKTNGVWTQDKFLPPDLTSTVSGIGLSSSISKDGNYLMVGSPYQYYNNNSATGVKTGSCYIFSKNNNNKWSSYILK